jgi:uncharacterized protein (DUF924 family)
MIQENILQFWFGPSPDDISPETAQRWFRKDSGFDHDIHVRFGKLYKAACAGAFASWAETARGRLALIVLLDQFSRNLHRESPHAWAQDKTCQELTRTGVELGQDTELRLSERVFFYMPFMHSEDDAYQTMSIQCFQRLIDDAPDARKEQFGRNLDFAFQHKAIIDRFGRYPHRNAILGRTSTPEERVFLKEPGSSF